MANVSLPQLFTVDSDNSFVYSDETRVDDGVMVMMSAHNDWDIRCEQLESDGCSVDYVVIRKPMHECNESLSFNTMTKKRSVPSNNVVPNSQINHSNVESSAKPSHSRPSVSHPSEQQRQIVYVQPQYRVFKKDLLDNFDEVTESEDSINTASTAINPIQNT